MSYWHLGTNWTLIVVMVAQIKGNNQKTPKAIQRKARLYLADGFLQGNSKTIRSWSEAATVSAAGERIVRVFIKTAEVAATLFVDIL
jgi:hypothetical protein